MEDQRQQPSPEQDALAHIDSTYPDYSATPSTPRVKGLQGWNTASSLDNRGTEDEYYDEDDIDELIDSGTSSESDSVPNTSSQQRFGESSTLRDSNYTPDMSGSYVLKPGATSCSLQESDSEDDSRPSKTSQKPKDASYATKNYCYFCSARSHKIARHLLKHIGEDSDLAKAFSLPKKSKERRRILDGFRTKGNYRHNQEVLRHHRGEIKLKRGPKKKGAVSFLHCPYCEGVFARKEMRKHVRKCPSRETSNSSTVGREKVLGKIALAESPLAQKLPPAVLKSLFDMKQDRVSFEVQNDVLLLKLAEHLSDKNPSNQRQSEYIRVRLREMGRLLIVLHEKSITSFQEAIKPSNFDKLVEGVKRIAGYSVERRSYTKPSLTLKLGRSLKRIGTIVLKQGNNDEQMKTDARRFIKLCEEEWALPTSHSSFGSLQGKKSKNPSTIPLTCDVQLFYRYLESVTASAVDSLKNTEEQDVYAELCRVALAKMSVLNKCAPEVSKVTLKAFQEREDATQVLSRHFISIKIENKEGQTVTVLLTSDLVSAISLLVSKRDACGVHKDNPFLFAKPNASPTSLYYGKESVRAFSILCRAKNPDHLQAAHCHKHIARVFQILTLENDELEHLAKLLGHNFRADKDFYQLPEAAVDLAKIAKLILAMEKGCLEKSKGRSLEEVEIEDELETDEEQLNPEISDAVEGDEDPHERDAVKQKAVMEKQRLRKREDRKKTPGKDVPEVENSGGSSSSAESFNDGDYIPEVVPGSDDSEEEHVPDGGASCDEDYSGNENQRDSKKKSVRASSKKRRYKEQSSDEDKSDSSSDKKPKAQRPVNKNYCFVCKKAQAKVARHFITHRFEDPDIAELFKLRKNSKERFQRLNELRARGNSEHNDRVLKTGCGELKVKRYTPKKPIVTKACLLCKERFPCLDIKKHILNCPVRTSEEILSCNLKVLSLVTSAELTDSSDTSSQMTCLTESMRDDEISAAVLNDSQLLLMARYFWLMNGKRTIYKDKIAQKLRGVGKLLLLLKKNSISSLEEVMKPENFKHVLEGLQELSDFNKERKSYGKPSLMRKMGYTLKCIADINYARALKQGDDKQRIDDAQTFMRLCLNEWGSVYKSKSAPAVPFISDVQLVFQSMEKSSESAFESLTKYECAPVYCALSKVTAAHLSLFNQNADVFELSLKSFQEKEEADAAVSQSQLEQILSAPFIKISVMNSKGKKIIMTLTPALLAALELLVSKREACEVDPNSLFLFAQPGAQCTNVLKGSRCFNTIVSRSNAEDKVILKTLSFRKHLTRVFQILYLSNDHLSQLAKLLGREILTDREYYRKPEAAPDIARLLELLSAVETGTLEKFEGKSFEEIEFADELEPHSAPVNPENSDAEGDDEESGSYSQKKGSAKKSSSRKKKPSSSSRKRPSKKSAQGERKERESGGMQESEDEASELDDERKEEVNSEQENCSEERLESFGGKTPQRTSTCGNNDRTNMSYSDNDDDMDVDFDSDDDVPRNEEKDEDDTRGSEGKPQLPSEKHVEKEEKSSKDELSSEDVSAAEDVDTDSEDHMEEDREEEGEKQSDLMDADSRSSSPLSDQENQRKVLAARIGTSEVRIVIPKLDLGKLKAPILVSQLLPSHKPTENDRPIHADKKQSQKSSTSAGAKNKASSEKEVQMICSHCQKIMTKGQTAYQKKGFTDVFCSKECLFKMFPVNKPVTRPCFHCSKEITNLSDLIMAAVDVKGTMKDFCSMTCLGSFKSNTETSQTQQPVCSMCKKSGTTKCGLMLKEVFYKFCSETCFEGFCKVNIAVCAKCKSTCYKPLKLKLREETKSLCSQSCLDDFTKENQQLRPCTVCHVFQQVSDMVSNNVGENVFELFCTRDCVKLYKLRPANHEEMKESAPSKKKNVGKQSAQVEIESAANSLVTSDPPDAKMMLRNAPTLMIGNSVYCSSCVQCMPPGRTVCPRRCVAAKTQDRKCFSCEEVILRPHSVILVPVGDKGTMKEVCSNKCLASINTKRSLSRCKMCNAGCISSNRLTLDEHRHTVCSNACFISYHKANNLPFVTCDVCSFGSLKQLTLRLDDGDKTVCSDVCLVKFKENIKKPQLCPMCQMFHLLSDMVEDQNDEGVLDFFCSNRCMLVHKGQSLTVSGIKISLISKEEEEEQEEENVKEEQVLLNMDFIKEEPIEEEYKLDPPSFISTEDIKEELNVTKDDLKTEEASGFSSPRDSMSTAPAATSVDVPPSCSNCKKVLTDGETTYQKKNNSEIFCSSPCLLKFFQMKEDKSSCTFCLQTITPKTRTVLQAPVDDEGTMKDFCGQTCVFSFNYKRMMSTKVSIVPVASHSQCNMCNRYCISKHELIHDAVIHKICSDPCFLRFCNLNKLMICVNCYANFETPLTVSMEDCCKHMCSAECLAEYKQKVKTPQPCAMCSTTLLMSDMVESKNSEGEVELFCNSNCVMASKIQAVSSSDAHVNCDNCGKSTKPACHFTMSDASIRSFCTQSCAMAFKGAIKKTNVSTQAAEASAQTQTAFLEPPKQLFCAQCQKVMKNSPKVIQEKDKVSFVCSLSCTEKFMRINNIFGKCEQCQTEKVVKITKKVDDRNCVFCSEGCKMLFHQELKKKWGEYCQSCAYCLSISRTLVTERFKRTAEKFCSKACRSRYSLLFRDLSLCDACGVQGRLSQSVSFTGAIKYFCDMTCVQRFCNKMLKDSSPQPVRAAQPSPVIANVVSLAGALAKRNSSTSCGSNSQITFSPFYYQTKVVGHVSVQTVPKELKNKSTLCTPLVHNKGVSTRSAIETVDTAAQTDHFEPRDRVLPVPVPVYVPLPLNMYSQFTPNPVGLPIPLPVPVFLPGNPNSLDEAVKPTHGDSFMEELDLKQEKNVQTDGVETEEGRRQEFLIPTEHSSHRRYERDPDQQADFNKQEKGCVNTSAGFLAQPQEESSSGSDTDESCERQRERTHQSLPSALETKEDQQSSAPAPSSQPAEKVLNKNKGRKLQHSPKEETRPGGLSKAVLRGIGRVESQCGVDAWKKWIQWRKTLKNTVNLKEEILLCSAAELSDSLCVFIKEVKQLEGEAFSPDRLFFLCLCIQQYLFENRRLENIFSDSVYARFCFEFTKILRGFKPSVSASGYIHFYVEEEFLWECKQLGAYSPIVLLNTLLFFCCKSLGFTTVEQHRQLSFTHISRRTKNNSNNTKSRFLLFYLPKSTTQAESDEDGVPAQKRKRNDSVTMMMENVVNPLRCPVRLYEFYLSKCPESARRHPNLFYLQPNRSCIPSSPLWFSCSPLDDSTMEAMLVRILAVRQMWGEDGGGSDQETDAEKTFLPDEENKD